MPASLQDQDAGPLQLTGYSRRSAHKMKKMQTSTKVNTMVAEATEEGLQGIFRAEEKHTW